MEKRLWAELETYTDPDDFSVKRLISNVKNDIFSFSEECEKHWRFIAHLNRQFSGLNLEEVEDELKEQVAN